MRNPARAAAVLGALAALAAAAPAHADLASLKSACAQRDAADGDTDNGVALPFVFCDDGVPPTGGTQANEGAVRALAVPQRYDGWGGLPPKVAPDPGSGADSSGDIALDVDLTLPDPERFPPPRTGYPIVVFMHGCCAGDKRGWEAQTIDAGGERWHYSNAWFASRGYAVLTYTSRGFVNAEGRGSTGFTEIQSRRYEVNDLQHLVAQLVDDDSLPIDPRRVVVTGGSYGAGLTWMALTDPTWTTPAGNSVEIVAVAPKYGWTDLLYSLVPTGRHMRDALPDTGGADSLAPPGVVKRSIMIGFYMSGKTGVPPGGPHSTFPRKIDEGFGCAQTADPYESSPACAGTLAVLLPEFVADRSAYYQEAFFARVREGLRVPIFSAGAFTDPLFTSVEHRRMVERLQREAGGDYPVQEYYGDYQHFVQNKTTEWADICVAGRERRLCTLADQAGDPRAAPRGRVRLGITTRLNRFLDHYARPQGAEREPEPRREVTASLQICPENAEGRPVGEPGERFTARSFDALATASARWELSGEQTTSNDAAPNEHAVDADPIGNSVANGGRCSVVSGPAGAGVATYETPPLERDVVMIGRTRLTIPHTGEGSGIRLAARLYDVLPDGRAVMVDRGVRIPVAPDETTVLDLQGNGWRFMPGHRVRVEIAQDDEPFVRASSQPSSLLLAGIAIDMPVREAGPSVRLSAPRLASDAGASRLFRLGVRAASGEVEPDHRFQLEARLSPGGSWRRIGGDRSEGALRFRGLLGRTYDLRARAVGGDGAEGPWSRATTVVPLDDFRGTDEIRYRGAWTRPRAAGAYEQRVSRSTRRGDSLALRFRGRRVDIVGRTVPAGGRALVVLDGRRRVVSFRSRRVRSRRVVASLATRGDGVHALRLVSLGGGPVEVDAIGILDRRP